MQILQPLRNRDFALLWGGMAVSLTGDGIYTVALAWQVYELSNVPMALALVGIAWTVSNLLVVLFGGVASDRLDRRRLMIASDLARSVVISAVAALSLTGTLELWHLFGLVALYGAADALFAPSFGAIVPDIVPRDRLVQANALDQVMRPLTFFLLGPALGGWAIASFGLGTAFALDAGSFLVSAAAIALMRTRRVERLVRGQPPSALTDLLHGLRFVRSQAWLWGSLLLSGVVVLVFWGPLEVLLPYLVKNEFHAGADTLGLILAAGGIGAALAGTVVAQLGLPARHVTVMWVTWGVGLGTVVGYGLAQAPWQAMLTAFVINVLFATSSVIWMTLLQTHVPPELLGRVLSLCWMVVTATAPISFALTGPLASLIGVRETLVAAGILGCALTLIGYLAIPGLLDPERRPAAPIHT